jgi:hypothetical protein
MIERREGQRFAAKITADDRPGGSGTKCTLSMEVFVTAMVGVVRRSEYRHHGSAAV